MPTSPKSLPIIVDRLKHLVAGLDINVPADRIEDTMFLFEGGLGLDSFAVLELIVAIEAAFDMEFPEQDLTPESFLDLRTLGTVVARNLSSQT